MATSWDKLGQAASILQLTGIDAFGLVSMIMQAAHTARRNRDLCQQLAQKVQIVSDLLGELQIPELRRHPKTRRPLDQLNDALFRAYKLVRSCSQQQENRSQLHQMLMGDDVATKLRLAKDEIDSYIILIPMITVVAAVKARGTQDVSEDETTNPAPAQRIQLSPQEVTQLFTLEELQPEGLLMGGKAKRNDWHLVEKIRKGLHGWGVSRFLPNNRGQNDHMLEFGQIKRFSWRELQIATNNFSEQNVLGKGGFGKVYKGVLPGPDSIKIAVKRLLNVESPEGEMAFLREVELISIAVHKNILRLIGFCTTPTERLLVYPFMENLSVASRLRDIKLNEPALDWSTRMRIALGAARGLEYLHEHCNAKIIHRDVKAANVLLDGNFEAVVGDFGLAKMMEIGRNTVTTGVRGTIGHIAPEYIKTGRPSVKTDTFGYGVMLLEIVTGKRALELHPDRMEEAGDIMLIDLVKRWMEEGRLLDLVDRNLGGVYNLEEMENVTQIALLCTHMEPDQRPAMSEVVKMLEGEIVPAERWEEWQLAELKRRQKHEMRQQGKLFSFSEESLNIQEAIELSTGR